MSAIVHVHGRQILDSRGNPTVEVEIGERALHVRVIEPDGCRPPLHLARVEQRRQRFGHVVEDALAALLLALDLLPARPHGARARDLLTAEDMRMAPDQLVVDPSSDQVEAPLVVFLEQEREEHNLVQEVAELVEQLRVVVCERGVGDLVGLLDRVWHDRLRGLLAVPRAVPAEAASERVELGQRLVEAQPVGTVEVGSSEVAPGVVAVEGGA